MGARRETMPMTAIEARAWPLYLAALFVVAFLWRLAYLNRLDHSVLAGSLTLDSGIYWKWADFLRSHGLAGSHPFFLGPLYPYVLAGVRALVGDSIPAVLRVQALWGAAATTLIAGAAGRLTRPAIGAIVGLLICFYEMAVYFDGLILIESLLFFLESFLLWWVVRSDWTAPRAGALLVVGIVVGLLAEGRAVELLLLLPASALIVARPGPWRSIAGRGAAVLAGCMVVTVPVAIRNQIVAGEWIPFTYNLGYNLYVGNHADATGGFAQITGTQQISSRWETGADGGTELDGRDYLRKAEGRDLSPAASSRYWAEKARRFAVAHPPDVARLTIRKLAMLWNHREYPQIENADEFRLVAGPLGIPFLGSFALLGGLALAGLWFLGPYGVRGRFLLGYVAVITLGVVPFFVTDRYRHHLVPGAALLGAVALARAHQALSGAPRGAQIRLALAAAAGFAVVFLPAPGFRPQEYAWRLAADLGDRYLHQGRPDLALGEFERGVAIVERSPADAGSPRGVAPAGLFFGYAQALESSGRRDEALPWLERARREAPDNAAVVHALADAYRRAGRSTAAESPYAGLPSLVGGEALALASRGWQAARAGRLEEAEALFANAVGKDPTRFDAWGALVRVRAQLGRLPAARAALDQARAAGIPLSPLRAHEALLDALAGDTAAARSALADVPASAMTADPSIAEVVRATHDLLARSQK